MSQLAFCEEGNIQPTTSGYSYAISGVALSGTVSEPGFAHEQGKNATADKLEDTMSKETYTQKPGTSDDNDIQVSEPSRVNRGDVKARRLDEYSTGAVLGETPSSCDGLEEELSAAVEFQSLQECENLLGKINDVRMRWEYGAAILKKAVELGKLDWTERLLWMGCDPNISNDASPTALLLAEEMCKMFPDNLDRTFILRLVKLASKLGGEKRDAPEVSHGSETSRVFSIRGEGKNRALGTVGETSREGFDGGNGGTCGFQGSVVKKRRDGTQIPSATDPIVDRSAKYSLVDENSLTSGLHRKQEETDRHIDATSGTGEVSLPRVEGGSGGTSALGGSSEPRGGNGCEANRYQSGNDEGLGQDNERSSGLSKCPDARGRVGEGTSGLGETLGGRGGSDATAEARGGTGSDDGPSRCHVVSESPMSLEKNPRSSVEEKLEHITSMLIELRQRIDFNSTENQEKGTMTLVDNDSIQRTAIFDPRTDVASIKSELLSELKSVKAETLSGNKVNKRELQAVKDSMDYLAIRMAEKDVLLRSLETSVTSLAEEIRASQPESEDDDSDSEPDPEIDLNDCNQCADELWEIAEYFGPEECSQNLSFYFYDMYIQGSLLSSMLKFMRDQRTWKMIVDFENSDIGARWPDLKDMEGVPFGERIPKVRSHASRSIVYVAMKIQGVYTEEQVYGWMAIGLARMAMLLAFGNRSKPYSKGNKGLAVKFGSVVRDAEQTLIRLGTSNCNFYIKNALQWNTQEAKEVALISAVPGIIAHYRRSEGVEILRAQLPSLLKYYRDHVVTSFERHTRS